jgi:hypothetical protein
VLVATSVIRKAWKQPKGLTNQKEEINPACTIDDLGVFDYYRTPGDMERYS